MKKLQFCTLFFVAFILVDFTQASSVEDRLDRIEKLLSELHAKTLGKKANVILEEGKTLNRVVTFSKNCKNMFPLKVAETTDAALGLIKVGSWNCLERKGNIGTQHSFYIVTTLSDPDSFYLVKTGDALLLKD